MRKKKVLFCSIAFPPKSDPECLQVAKYFKYLSQATGYDFDVVTSKDNTLFMSVDEGLRSYDVGFVNKVKLPIYENKYLNFLIRKINHNRLLKPDSKFSFIKGFKKVIKNLSKPDIIYSRSYPMSSAFLAEKLKDYYEVPWVMHLSDPWVGSPFHHFAPDLEKELASATLT